MKYKYQNTSKEYAKRYKCDTRTIDRARAAGAPLDDPAAMADWFAARNNPPPQAQDVKGSIIGSIADAKLEKLRRECERLQLRIDSERKRLIPVDQVRRDMVRIANAFRSELMRFAGDIPNWEGLPAAALQKRVDEKVESLCTDLANAFSELYQ